MLTWTLTLIWSMVLLGAAGVIWLMLGTFRLEQRRGDFVSAVTHELRTPLTSFSLYTEMLEDGMVPEQKKPEYYANMQRECRRLEHLIENVLSYSRLQRNAIRRTRDTLTCQELFEPIAEKIDRRLREAGISFSFALAQPIRILPIHTDAVSVEQIMDNLTSNAIKYARGKTPKSSSPSRRTATTSSSASGITARASPRKTASWCSSPSGARRTPPTAASPA